MVRSWCAVCLSLAVLAASARADSLDSHYATTIQAQGPFAYWGLDETGGGTAFDLSGNGNDGAYTAGPMFGSLGPQPADYLGFSSSNRAPSLNGTSNQRIRATFPALSDNYSVSMWVRNERPTSGSGSDAITAYLFSRSDTTGGGSETVADNFGINGRYTGLNDGDPGDVFYFNNSQNQAGDLGFANGDDTWHHVAFTRDGSTVTGYYDGDVSFTASLPVTYSNGDEFTFGSRADLFADLDGQLDEIAIFDRVLSPLEVEAQFLAGINPLPPLTPEPGSLALWSLLGAAVVCHCWRRRSAGR